MDSRKNITDKQFFIHDAKSSDDKKIFEIVNAAYAIEKEENGLFSFKTKDRFETLECVQALLKTNGVKTFVAVEISNSEVKIVGTVFVAIEYLNKSKCAIIGPFAVIPEYQKQNVGRKILKIVDEYCRKENVKILEAHVINWRTDLWPIYKKLGFKETKKTVIFDESLSTRNGTYQVVFARFIE